MDKIIDTNLPMTAAGEQDSMGEACTMACVQVIRDLYDNTFRLVLDDAGIIFDQYRSNLKKDRDQGLAWKFMAWVLQNQYIEDKVKLVNINPVGDYGDFEELPDEVRDSSFDRSDRVFIALSVANRNTASIVQAADSKWIGFEEMLARHGVRLEFPCREALQEVHQRKKKSKRRK